VTDENGEVIRIPKWILLFVLPVAGFIAMAVHNEIVTNEPAARVSRLGERYEMHLERDHESARAFSELSQRVRWLCAQHERETRGEPLSGECP
jgi:hypothetical protein